MVTTTKATPTTTVQPLTRGPIHCHNEADFPDHNYINPKDQDDYAKQLKDIFELETIGPNGGFLMPINHNGGWLSYSGTWVDGCVTTVSRQNIYYPLGESNEVTAYMLMRDNYVLCKLSFSFLVLLFSMGFKNREDRKKK